MDIIGQAEVREAHVAQGEESTRNRALTST